MNDEELRTLVRAAIARHAEMPAAGPAQRLPPPAMLQLHASHGMFTLPSGSELEGPCLIEPAVMCNHCGYCKSWGH